MNTTSKLRGYSIPLTPDGKFSAVSAPPWIYCGDVTQFEYKIDDKDFLDFLPQNLSIDANEGPIVQIAFTKMEAVGSGYPNQAYEEPETVGFAECLVKLKIRLGDQIGWFVTHSWVTSDAALVRGILQGFPKRMGMVAMTSFNSQIPELGGRRPKAKIGCALDVPGGITVRAIHHCDSPVPTDSWERHPFILRQHLPELDANSSPLYDRFVSPIVKNHLDQDAWQGKAELRVGDASQTDLAKLLTPVNDVSSRSFRTQLTITGSSQLDA